MAVPIKKQIKNVLKTSIQRVLHEDSITRWRSLGAKIGENVFIGFDVAIDEGFAPLLTIEEGAVISARCLIILHDSAFNNVSGLPIKVGRVIIGREAYIGVNTVILCGVSIGARAIVGANATVVSDIPTETVAFGSPARVAGSLSEFQQRYKEKMTSGGPFQYWDILPWRERPQHLNSEEFDASYEELIKRFHGST